MSYHNRSSSSRQNSSRQPSSRSPHPDRFQEQDKWSRAASDISNNKPFEPNPDDYAEQTRRVQNDSLEASSRALGKLIVASETAQSNLAKLASQSEQINKVTQRLDDADHYVKVNEAKASRLKALNGWFFLPAIGSKSAKRKEEKLAKLAQEKIDQGAGSGSSRNSGRSSGMSGSPNISSRGSSAGGSVTSQYSTPAGLSRDSVEEGIDSNLNQISAGLGRLKMMGSSMNSELESQRIKLGHIQDKADENKDKIGRLNNQMTKLSK